MPRKIRKILFASAILLLSAVLVGTIYVLSMSFRMNDERLRSDYPNLTVQFSAGVRIVQKLHHDPSKPIVIFIHGAPGSSSQFLPYLQDSDLASQVSLLAIDRPGYGYSNYGEPIVDLYEQALTIHRSLEEVLPDSSTWILVTHSYGGPIGACLSQIDSHRIKYHLMLSPVIDPNSEKEFWFSPVPNWVPFRWVSSGSMRSAATEKMSHTVALRSIEWAMKEVGVATHHVHGAKDWLAPMPNVTYAQSIFDRSILKTTLLEDRSHFIPFEDLEMVKGFIYDALGEVVKL